MSLATNPIAAAPLAAGSVTVASHYLRATLAQGLDVSSRIHGVVAGPLDCNPPLNATQTAMVAFTLGATWLHAGSLGSVALGSITTTYDYSVPLQTVSAVMISTYLEGVVLFTYDCSAPLQAVNGQALAFPSLAVGAVFLNFNAPALASLSAPGAIQADYSTATLAAASSHAVPLRSVFCLPFELSGQLKTVQSGSIFFAIAALATAGAPLSIQELNIILSTLSAPLDMGTQSVIMPAPVYTVFSAGVNITDLITGAEIKQDINSAHASFSFSSTSPELFESLNSPEALTITINGVAREFILEEVSMTGDLAFNVWGRSASCLLDSPHHEQITIETDGSQTAAELALDIAGVTLFEAVDYPLPDGWSMTGTPIEIVGRLAAAVGAVVQPDGFGVKVMARFPVRPLDWSASPPAAVYSREQNILSLSWDDEGKTAWNSVAVTGRTAPWQAPLLELEESSPQPRDTVHVRVFRKGTSEALFESMVTAGAVSPVGQNTATIENELVQFSSYRGGLKYPAADILSFVWIGAGRGDIYWLSGGRSTELELAPGGTPDLDGFGLASITYRTDYERYRLAGHDVPQLLLICSQPDSTAVRVKLLIDGLHEPAAAALTEELATTEAAAVAAGTAWLDANRYNERKISASAPHEATALPGSIVSLADEIENVSGPGMVTARTIRINGPAVIDSLEVIQCLS